ICLKHDVDFGRTYSAVVLWVLTGYRLQKNAFGQAHALLFGKLFRRHDLAARHARHVRNDRLDSRDAMILEELLDAAGHDSSFRKAPATRRAERGEQGA